MKEAVEKIEKHSEVRCFVYQEGGTRFPKKGSVTDDGSESSDFLYIKQQADKFYNEVNNGEHKYRRFAILQAYTTLPNFNQSKHFKPYDYRQAEEKSRQLFEDFTLYQSYDTLLTNIRKDRFSGGGAVKEELESKRTDEIEKIRLKVENIAADPAKELSIGFNYLRAEQFYVMVINAIKTVTYIAQSRMTEVGESTSDIALPELSSRATKLFEFQAYDFSDVLGTKVVSFGRSTSDRDSFGCTFGQHIDQFDGWKEESCLWVFPTHLKSIADRTVFVQKSNTKNHIRLELLEKKLKPLFQFYVNVY
ncbi:hypothetical protein BDV30DRAFT_235267 [Aspergillus minisclerotigenes]|uniref:Uncharacterized protein n=1 Tax=Aspergillus minisclerotigenes TaxID=656917 RepID=A0A5N6JFE2_9EURO|nr:hypothetical protein BDV30DRAFT_235267 [Aspergillus minisclerotigenes]